jgi:hypothetical protein
VGFLVETKPRVAESSRRIHLAENEGYLAFPPQPAPLHCLW